MNTITDIVTCQETGKASLVKMLKALGIPRDQWNQTVLQVTAFVIPVKEDESCEMNKI